MDYIYAEHLATTAGLAKINKCNIVVLMEQAKSSVGIYIFYLFVLFFLELIMSVVAYLI